MLKLKTNLLIEILASNNSINKYSKALLNLKTIIELEKIDNFKLPHFILEKFEKLKQKDKNFISGIPLNLIEHYFYKKIDNMNSYIYIEYGGQELNIKTNEIYILLEEFFKEIFILASHIANYYNLEIKVNENKKNENFV